MTTVTIEILDWVGTGAADLVLYDGGGSVIDSATSTIVASAESIELSAAGAVAFGVSGCETQAVGPNEGESTQVRPADTPKSRLWPTTRRSIGLRVSDETILVVDDEPANLAALVQILRPSYRVRAATSGPRAIAAALAPPKPDMVLLDVLMPGMDGYQTLVELRANQGTRDIPVIFVTTLGDQTNEERGLELGAADYIAKPVRPPIVLARVRAHLDTKRARDWLSRQNARLENEVARRTAETDLTEVVSIRALAHLAEIRDPETGDHILRTQAYVRLLALRVRQRPRFRVALTDRYVELLVRSAPLHDIGKVGVPDHILRKPGRLTPDEWEVMKTHARLGAEAIEFAERDLDRPVEFLALAKDIARWHHEHWDGGGYPDGLVGEEIPISARLMALADVFDALVSTRVYKDPMPVAEARDVVEAGRGQHFDPDVVDAFLQGFGEFVDVLQRFRGES